MHYNGGSLLEHITTFFHLQKVFMFQNTDIQCMFVFHLEQRVDGNHIPPEEWLFPELWKGMNVTLPKGLENWF